MKLVADVGAVVVAAVVVAAAASVMLGALVPHQAVSGSASSLVPVEASTALEESSLAVLDSWAGKGRSDLPPGLAPFDLERRLQADFESGSACPSSGSVYLTEVVPYHHRR